MSTKTFSTFFALLSLLTWTGTVLALGAVAAQRVAGRREGGSGSSPLANVIGPLRDNALWLAWLVAAVATAGSLYYSEVAHFTPCPLCWYQRIAMYPMAVILLVAAVRRDLPSRWYVLPQLVVGAAIAGYHTQLQAFPRHGSPFCSTTEPCTTRYVWELGFVSLPFMALAAFAFVIAMVCIAPTSDPGPDRAVARSEGDAPAVRVRTREPAGAS